MKTNCANLLPSSPRLNALPRTSNTHFKLQTVSGLPVVTLVFQTLCPVSVAIDAQVFGTKVKPDSTALEVLPKEMYVF